MSSRNLARMAAVVAFLVSGLASAQIVGSDHDFSAQAWTGEICSVCHTPHNADASVASDAAPLWDHEVTTSTFTTYGSGYDMESTAGQPTGTSLLCLSCHDGTVALDSFGGRTPTAGPIAGNANFGTDLSNDHPIGILYTATEIAADGELQPLTNTYTQPVTGATLTVGEGLLDNGSTVECSSCHDVHATNVSNVLLKVDNTSSALCLACHDK